METVRLTKRINEPITVVVTWYRGSEDNPTTSGPVFNEYGHRVWANWGGHYGKWYTLGADGGYYECDTPEYWCYIPKAPYPYGLSV